MQRSQPPSTAQSCDLLGANPEAVDGNREVPVGVRVYAQDDERLFVCVDRQVHRFLLSLRKPAFLYAGPEARRTGWTCEARRVRKVVRVGTECPRVALPSSLLSASFAYLGPDSDCYHGGGKDQNRNRAVEGKDHFP